MSFFDGSKIEGVMTFEQLTKVKGPVNRHLEALWAEIKTLKERVEKLEKERKHE